MAASAGAVRAGSAFVEIFARDGAFQQAMSRIRTRMQTLGTQMRQVGTGMALGGAAIGAPMIMAVRQFAALDDAIRATAAAAGVGEGGLAAMRASAQDLGLKFGMAADGVATLQVELARAFGDKLNPQQFTEVTESVLALAKASGTEGATAAAIMTSTLAQFGMGAGESARVADVLTLAANATLNSVEGLGEALKYVGPVAADAGMSLEDTVAVLGTLGNLGIQGSEAGTSMRRLLAITGAEAEKLKEIFGVSFLDAAGNVRPLVDTLGEVADATNGLASGDRIKRFNDAFGLLGITSARAIGKSAADTRQLQQQLQNATGTANQQAAFMEAGVGGAMRRLGSAIGNVAEAFGAALAPALLSAASILQGLASAMQTFIEQNPMLANVAAGSAAALVAFGAAGIAGGIALQGLASGLRILQAALALIPALFTPVGLAVAGLAVGIVGGVAAARTLSPAFKEETDAIMAALMRLDFGAAWQLLNVNVAIALVKMHQQFSQAFDAVYDSVAGVSVFIGDKLIEGMDRFMGIFGADILTLQAGFEKLGIYKKAAFDWSFAANGMTEAIADVDRRVEEARKKAPTADARAQERKDQRQADADRRKADSKKRDAAFGDTLEQLQKDRERALERAIGGGPQPAQPQQTQEKGPTPQPQRMPVAPAATPAAAADKGVVSASNFSGLGLEVGPEFGALQDPAQRTADATERTALAVEGIANAAAPPGVAMNAIAPMAPAAMAAVNGGQQVAAGATQNGVSFEAVGGKIVAAIEEGTAVSRQMLAKLGEIASAKPSELRFT